MSVLFWVIAAVLLVGYIALVKRVAEASFEVLWEKEQGTIRSWILFPFSNLCEKVGEPAFTRDPFLSDGNPVLMDKGRELLGDVQEKGLPSWYYAWTFVFLPLRIAWFLFLLCTAILFSRRVKLTEKERKVPKVRVDTAAVEDAEIEAKLTELYASREKRKSYVQACEALDRRIAELEAELEMPQGNAYRGKTPAIKYKDN